MICNVSSVLQAVHAEFKSGPADTLRRGNKEFRRFRCLPGYWVWEDGLLWKDKKGEPHKTVATHTTGGTIRYTFARVGGVRRALPLAKLVLAAFLPPPHPSCALVRYKDGDRRNCALGNLEYRPTKGYVRKRGVTAVSEPARPEERRLSEGEAGTAVYLAGKGKTAPEIARRLYSTEARVEEALREARFGRLNARKGGG